MGYPPLRKISPAGLVVPLTRPAGAAAFNDKNLGYLKYLKSVPYTDAFNDAKTWTKMGAPGPGVVSSGQTGHVGDA